MCIRDRSNTEGGISFMAPKPATETLQGRSASSIKNWMAQVGGINIAKKVEKHVAKEKLASFIERIEVEAIRFETVLKRMKWVTTDDSGSNALPDIFVVDSEGHDDVILNVVLDDISRHYGANARIPLMLYEFKHFTEERHYGMLKRLAGLGYCLSIVGEDVVAVHMSVAVSYTHLRAHETPEHLVCRLLLEKKKTPSFSLITPSLIHISDPTRPYYIS
eukprot:TRINITY_DN33007_c0_g1_i1.p1 TRINITY_DN33007_c0_g1~~TRINITY_DN33007_c0_g1_i1.p1  ORF type:complete len:219 (+),score=51.10 TRINITY_DN33007_c0_g1_i1:164-820(+)